MVFLLLDYCLKVDDHSTYVKNGICGSICYKFSVNMRQAIKNIVRESWHIQAGITIDYNCM